MSAFLFLAPSRESLKKEPLIPLLLCSWLGYAGTGKRDGRNRAGVFDSADFKCMFSLLDKSLVNIKSTGGEKMQFLFFFILCTLFKAYPTTTSLFINLFKILELRPLKSCRSNSAGLEPDILKWEQSYFL